MGINMVPSVHIVHKHQHSLSDTVTQTMDIHIALGGNINIAPICLKTVDTDIAFGDRTESGYQYGLK